MPVGADKPGVVMVQSYQPDVPALQFAKSHDYQAFAQDELAGRKLMALPPYKRLARVVVRATSLDKASNLAPGGLCTITDRSPTCTTGSGTATGTMPDRAFAGLFPVPGVDQQLAGAGPVGGVESVAAFVASKSLSVGYGPISDVVNT